MSTEKQIETNRENAKLSTGPRSEQGKRTSSLNAVKTGLTGRTVLLAGDDLAAYQQLAERHIRQYRPVGDEEKTLVQSITDSEWRLLRIPALEAGIYALGRLEFAALFDDDDPAVCASLIEAKTFLVYQRQLNNLSVQEARLRRQMEKDREKLQSLQKGTETSEKSNHPEVQSVSKARRRYRLMLAATQYKRCLENNLPFNPNEFGFEFSKEEIEDWGCTLREPFAAFFQALRHDRAA